jgi:hypothetical protein
MSALTSGDSVLAQERARCDCGARLFVKLTRDDDGTIRRESYCANATAHLGSVDVTNASERRALLLAVAARSVA